MLDFRPIAFVLGILLCILAAAMLVPALFGIPVAEYGANHIKKSVVGVGHAGKAQVQAMIAHLLPTAQATSADAADALAVAVCHAHHRETGRRLAAIAGAASR